MVSYVAIFVALAAVAMPFLVSLLIDGWIRDYVGSVNFSLDKIPNLSGKTAIVTGSSNYELLPNKYDLRGLFNTRLDHTFSSGPTFGGIGYHSALELARHGARVILAGRSASKGFESVAAIKEELGPSANVDFSVLDLSDLRSVQSFADDFVKSKQPLHILMNNAGVMACPFGLTAQGLEMQFGTNHVGHFLLTKKLLPVLRRSQPSRVVTVSSAAHYIPELLGGDNMTDVFADSNML